MSRVDDIHWFVVFNGAADRWLWSFEADGWEFFCSQPAAGSLAVIPPKGGRPATIDEARWLADVCAFDHDAPVGLFPALEGETPGDAVPKDSSAEPPAQPVHPFEGPWGRFYWDSLNQAFSAAAELRFNGSYVLRYDQDDDASPSTDFASRFKDREHLIGLYAMASRQADLLSEYLCLYRVLEAADGLNGTDFVVANLKLLAHHDFGDLRAVEDSIGGEYDTAPNVFEVYGGRAAAELERLEGNDANVPAHLYSLRNSLAHGKRDILTASHGDRFRDAAAALPIVKLLARIAVEPDQ